MESFGIGFVELFLSLLIVPVCIYLRGTKRRWACAALVIVVVSSAVTPADPLSMIIVAATLSVVFITGVFTASFFRSKSKTS